jgi:hypothetical protein
MHLKGARHELTWWSRSRHRKHLPRAQRLKARLRSRPSFRSKDDGSRLGRPPRPTCTHSSSSPRPLQGSTGASSTCTEPANGDRGANSSSSSSSSEPKEATQSKLGAGSTSSARGTSAGPPKAAGDRDSDKEPSPSTKTAGSLAREELLVAGGVMGANSSSSEPSSSLAKETHDPVATAPPK